MSLKKFRCYKSYMEGVEITHAKDQLVMTLMKRKKDVGKIENLV